ncbi:growth factor receptor-bound protein 10-like [Neodiprion virginianus]|uniref:growth factor receptor-bound protein 10-like n=1 Tax=Neodiprion virginianus TaxID=2961670 RepID=UPI001EE6C5E9|nr:growth factor receptor-bound protein 10-like [Neodiprion virginianus]
MGIYAPNTLNRFLFRQDTRKYEFYHDPKQFFPDDMVDFESREFGGPSANRHAVMQNLLTTTWKCPSIFSTAWIRDAGKNVWTKIYMVLRYSKPYCSPKAHLVSRVIRQWRHADSPRSLASSLEQLEVLAHLTDYHVYWTLNAKKQFCAPTELGICLRPTANAETEGTAGNDFRCIAFDNEKTRVCWIIAMRLAKYRKQLRENYRAFKNKQCEPTVSPKKYNYNLLSLTTLWWSEAI